MTTINRKWTQGTYRASGSAVLAGANCIAITDMDNDTLARYIANALLFAAAPDLFDGLAEVLDSRAPDYADAAHSGWSLRARAALAKALGEPSP